MVFETTTSSGARCKTCNAVDAQGRPLRGEIDALKAASGSSMEVMRLLSAYGIKVALRNVERHFQLHSPWARNATLLKAQTRVLEERKKLEIKRRDAMAEIQKIIDIGGAMVENWVEGTEGVPVMPIDRELYKFALESAIRSSAMGNVDLLQINVDKAIFMTPVALEEEIASPDKITLKTDHAKS